MTATLFHPNPVEVAISGNMKTLCLRMCCLIGLLAVLVVGGCSRKHRTKDGVIGLTPKEELGRTIGEVAQLPVPQPFTVEGYGLVGGLAGTGSADCPAPVRAYLKRYVAMEMPGHSINLDRFIQSRNTAVVRLEAQMPAMPSDKERFDVRVSVLAGSGTTSLHGGWLYPAELKLPGTLGVAGRPTGTVEGAVFVNAVGAGSPDLTTGYVLGGGRSNYEYRGLVKLRRAHFAVASEVRNRINERYGPGTAVAVSQVDIELRIPPRYRWRKSQFLSLVNATYVEQTAELIEARINAFVYDLAVSAAKTESEIALEVIGRACLPKLQTLLKASDEEIRFRAGRCMLNLSDDQGLVALREIALDPGSSRRLDALAAVVVSGRRNDATALARRLLQDPDARVVLAAYEHLRRLEDATVVQESIGRSFYLEQVAQCPHKAVYVSRSGEPRVVLFGGTLMCRDSIFVQSPDGAIIINSPAGQNFVSVTRNHPTKPGVIGPLKTSFDLRDLVRMLGSEPGSDPQGAGPGFGVCYGDVAVLLQQLVAKEVVPAEFWAGPLPKIGPIVKK